MQKKQLLLAFYGDDFTGSTDALEFLSRAGARTVLLLQPPTESTAEKFAYYDAIGIAGATRSLSPFAMEQELHPAFMAMKQWGAAHIHYKVCSTFDSSPQIGSIGKAIDVGAEVFQSDLIPLLVAAPVLGRYCVFGNLFARMGTSSTGAIYRLDRHPSMSRHPVTPANESDLCLHLSRQTTKKIGLIDILQLGMKGAVGREVLIAEGQKGSQVILLDALYPEQMTGIGQLLDSYAAIKKPLFSVGSSGVEMALGAHWNNTGRLQPRTEWADPGRATPLLVLSGSCSPVTEAQITWALNRGFAEVALDTEAIACCGAFTAVAEEQAAIVRALLQQGRNVVVHTSRGADDQRVERTKAILSAKGWDDTKIRTHTAPLYGAALGRIARNVAAQTEIRRVVVAGGDTSSFAAREMGIEAVEMIAPLSPGAPLCRAFAPGSPIDGLEVNFKGGQVGGEEYFGRVLEGK